MKWTIFMLFAILGCDQYPGIENCILTPNQEFDKNPKCFTTAILIAQDWEEMQEHTHEQARYRETTQNKQGERVLTQHSFIENLDTERIPPTGYRATPAKHPQRKVIVARATQKPHGWHVELFYALALGQERVQVYDRNWNEVPQLGVLPLISGFAESEQSGNFRSYTFNVNYQNNYTYLVIPGHTNMILTRR